MRNTFHVVDGRNGKTFQLDHFCRVKIVDDDHKGRFIVRAMLKQQRSFLLQAKTQGEVELWYEAIKMATEMYKS